MAFDFKNLNSKKILIDGRRLGKHGIGVYTENLILALIEFNKINNLNITFGVIVNPNFKESKDSDYKIWSNKVNLHYLSFSGYSLKEYLFFGKLIDALDYDLVHIPHYTLPLNLKTKSVVTIHDIIHITHPEKFYYPLIAKTLIKHALKKAFTLITVSEASKKQILKSFKINKNKISVIPNLYNLKKSQEKQNKEKKQEYFTAIISTFKKHKGLKFLIDAFKAFNIENPDYKLILLGSGIEEAKKDYEYSKLFTKNVIALGRVSNQELNETLSSSKALCVASDIEGFCIPILEAHALNVPVVAKPLEVLKELEIKGFDSFSKDSSLKSYKEAMNNIVNRNLEISDSIKNDLSKSLDRFSFNRVAKQILEEYSKVLHN